MSGDMTAAEHRRHAEVRQRVRQLYAAIENLVKRHGIHQFLMTATTILRKSFGDASMMTKWPPHRIIHAMEACCAYSRMTQYDEITYNRLAKLMNLYHEYLDPLQQDALKNNLDHFVRLLYREQMELQHQQSQDAIARDLTLYATDESLPKSARSFVEQFGLTPFQWIKLSFLSAVAAEKEPAGLFKIHSVPSFEKLDMPESAVMNYFRLSSRTPAQIGRYFKETRPIGREYFYSSVGSVFLETPFIRFDEETALAPLTSLVFRHSGQGLYRLMREIDSFDDEISTGFERYVEKVLNCFESKVSIHSAKALQRYAPGKNADFLVELEDEILVVECKATSSTARDLTENALDTDTATRKLAKGIIQLYTSAHDLEAGIFGKLGVDRRKPVTGAVVTLGEVVHANSRWFFDKFVLAKAEPKLKEPIYPSSKMPRLPVAMSISVLERLVMACNVLSSTPGTLYDAKEHTHYWLEGDWDQFLNKRLQESNLPITGLAFLADQKSRLLESLGIADWQE